MKGIVKFFVGLCILAVVLDERVQAKCSESLKNNAKSCVSRFFQDVQNKSEGNCSAMYQGLRGCIRKAAEKCANRTNLKEERNSIWVKARVYAASEDYYCVRGMFDTSHYITFNTLGNKCKTKLFKRVRQCDKSFHQAFQKNRSSSDLCRQYEKAKRCVLKRLQKFCPVNTLEIELAQRPYQDPFNPYCRKALPTSDQPVKVGKCTVEQFYNNSKQCIINFVQTLQKNNQLSCGKVFDQEFTPCLRGLYKTCAANMEPNEIVKRRKSRFCNFPDSIQVLTVLRKEYFVILPSYGATFREKVQLQKKQR